MVLRPQSLPLVIVGWWSWRENGKANHLALPLEEERSSVREGVMRSVGGGGAHIIPVWAGKVRSGWDDAAWEWDVVACEAPVRSSVSREENGLCDSWVVSVWGVAVV